MAMGDSVKVLEKCVVAPLPGTTKGKMSLPLTFFDVIWICFLPVERLIFFELPISRSHFVDNYMPKLKDSLSSTLKHFLPLAGNLIIPSDSRIPEIRYTDGDGVSIVFAESCHDNFKHLTQNYRRHCSEFHPLVPQLPQPSSSSELNCSRVQPVLALQVTLFPDVGISLGLTNHHAVGDAGTIFNFMKAWALNSKFGEDEGSLGSESLPLYDRSVIKDPKGIASLLWNQMRSLNLHLLSNVVKLTTDTNKIRQTFVLDPKDIKKLKNLVYTKRPTVKHLSSFTVTCAYVWTCLAKCRDGSEEVVDEEKLEIFGFPVDCRARLDPPVPANYFGNCLNFYIVQAKNNELLGHEGFLLAAEMVGEIIHQKLQNKNEILKDAEAWITTLMNLDWKPSLSVAGSPRFNYYDLDFGWGKPIKFECTSIDQTGAMSLSGCRDLAGGLEIGLSFSKAKIDAFATVFKEGLAAL